LGMGREAQLDMGRAGPNIIHKTTTKLIKVYFG